MAGPPRPPDDDDRLRAAVPRRRRLPASWAASCSARSCAAGEPDGLRIGIVPGELWDDCDPEVIAACRDALEALREATGGTVTEVDFDGPRARPDRLDPGRPDRGARRLDPGADRRARRRTSAWSRGRCFATGSCFPAVAISKAQRVRTLVRRSLADLFERVDVLAWPTVAAPAPPLENPTVELPSGAYPADYVNPRQGGIANLAGVPAISVPVGRRSEGLPIALQLIAAVGPRRAAPGRRGGARARRTRRALGRRGASRPDAPASS